MKRLRYWREAKAASRARAVLVSLRIGWLRLWGNCWPQRTAFVVHILDQVRLCLRIFALMTAFALASAKSRFSIPRIHCAPIRNVR
jgi:hypothetical protein